MELMPLVDSWDAIEPLYIPEDMKKEYPIGAKLENAVVVGYELAVLYNWKPKWLVTLLFADGKISSFEREWMKGSKIQEIIKFDTAEELAKKAIGVE